MNNKELGRMGEEIAVEFLQKQGLKLLEKNYTCSLGEVDIVLKHKDTWVFCEVKTRRDLEFGDPMDFITKQKLARIERVGTYYTMVNNLIPCSCRIDAVGIHFINGKPQIRWIENCTL